MIKVSGLRVVKSSDRNSDLEQEEKNAQLSPKKVFTGKRKNDFQQKTSRREPCKTGYNGVDKWKNIGPDKETGAMFNNGCLHMILPKGWKSTATLLSPLIQKVS